MLLTSNVVTAAGIVINNHCYLLVAMAKSYKKKERNDQLPSTIEMYSKHLGE